MFDLDRRIGRSVREASVITPVSYLESVLTPSRIQLIAGGGGVIGVQVRGIYDILYGISLILR